MCQQHKYCILKTNFIAFGHFPSIYNAKIVHFRPILTIIYYCFGRISAILSFAFRYVTFEPFTSGSSSTPHFEAERQLYNISKDKNWDFSNLWTPPYGLNLFIFCKLCKCAFEQWQSLKVQILPVHRTVQLPLNYSNGSENC